MIEILPPIGKYKYDTWRILLMKCYIDNLVRLRSCIRNINSGESGREKAGNEKATRAVFNSGGGGVWRCSGSKVCSSTGGAGGGSSSRH
jgi:hypothetical protein